MSRKSKRLKDRLSAVVLRYGQTCKSNAVEKEHAALVRAVRRLQVKPFGLQSKGYAMAIEHVLALLAARKGKKS